MMNLTQTVTLEISEKDAEVISAFYNLLAKQDMYSFERWDEILEAINYLTRRDVRDTEEVIDDALMIRIVERTKKC